MKKLIKNARVVDSRSEWNGKQVDLFIENGIISKIGRGINVEADEMIESKNLHVSIGWFDMSVHFSDPGDEHKEDLESGMNAAEAGGFTGVGLMPDTSPSISNKTQIEYIHNKTRDKKVQVIPYGTLSHKMEGENISEMYDMWQAGARAFTDTKNNVRTGLLSRALMYAKNFDGLIFSFPEDTSLTKGGLMHEGTEHVQLGLKGIPALAEEIQIMRDIYLAEYNETRLHFSNVSTEKGVELIRQAKKRGLKITAQTSVHHLFFSDKDMHTFDTNLKVNPPLRSAKDQEALVTGLKDGTIDCISSEHNPQDIEVKKTEFDKAEFGCIGLEAAFGAANKAAGKIGLEKLIEKITVNPRSILGLEIPEIKEGMKANLTLFDPETEYEFSDAMLKSRSRNCPYTGKTLKGKALQTIY